MAEIVAKLISEKHHLILHPLAGTKTISSLDPKKQHHHHRHNKSNPLFWYVSNDFFSYHIKAGVRTKSKAVGVYDITAEKGVSLQDVLTFLPGDLSRKFLSQGQVLKVCKHFKEWLKSDGFTFFICKINEENPVNIEDPWSNLMVIEIELDHENDLAARIVSQSSLEQKSIFEKNFHVIIPKRTKLKK